MELMKTLDDAWNSKAWDIFEERHANTVIVFWPDQPEPTSDLYNHRKESIEFFEIFPDNRLVNNPYKMFFSKDDYTCSVTDFPGTFKGEMKVLDGKMIQPTNKKFHIEFCAVAQWKNGNPRWEDVLWPSRIVGLDWRNTF